MMTPQGHIVAASDMRLLPYITSVSADERRFAFIGAPLADIPAMRANFGVYIAEFNEHEPRKLLGLPFPADRPYTDVTTRATLDWSPDSQTVLLSNEQAVFLIEAQSGASRKLVDGGGAQWSPFSDWISYVTVKREAALLNIRTGETRLIDKGHEVLRPLAWSPDGRYLLIAEGAGSHVPYGCLWIYRVSDEAFMPIPEYGMAGPRPNWIRIGSSN